MKWKIVFITLQNDDDDIRQMELPNVLCALLPMAYDDSTSINSVERTRISLFTINIFILLYTANKRI